jgi:hypothetical protein
MTLSCGHVFCQFCIGEWEAKCGKKSNFTCPNCRQPVISFTRSLHLENLISALYRDIDDSIAQEREQLIKERQAEIEKAKMDKAKAATKKKGRPTPRTGTIRDWTMQPQHQVVQLTPVPRMQPQHQVVQLTPVPRMQPQHLVVQLTPVPSGSVPSQIVQAVQDTNGHELAAASVRPSEAM